MNILNKPVEEKNVIFLTNSIGKFNIFSQIQNKKSNILDYVSKLISKNGQRNLEVINLTGTVKLKHNIL